MKKRLTLYERKDIEFQKIYQKKIIELRANQAKIQESRSTERDDTVSPLMSMVASIQTLQNQTPSGSTIDQKKLDVVKAQLEVAKDK